MTHNCIKEEGFQVVMETGVDHTTIVVEQKHILHIKLVILFIVGVIGRERDRDREREKERERSSYTHYQLLSLPLLKGCHILSQGMANMASRSLPSDRAEI